MFEENNIGEDNKTLNIVGGVVMKKIALDLDGVVFDSENLYRVYTEMYDVDVFQRNSLINNSARIYQKRYCWDDKHFDYFYQHYAHKVLKAANLMTGVDLVLPRLRKSYQFIIITSRSDEEVNIAQSALAMIGLQEAKIFNGELSKIERFQKEQVAYVIDDDEDICKAAAQNGIYALYFKNAASDSIEETEFLKVVHNWGEIYKYLMLEEKR